MICKSIKTSGNRLLCQLFFFIFLFVIFLSPSYLRAGDHKKPGTDPLPPCIPSGPAPVTTGQTATYTLPGACSAIYWTVSCGTVISSTSNSAVISFNDYSGCTSATISATTSTNTVSFTITVNPALPLSAGSISNPTQTIAYEGPVSQLNGLTATNGSCGGAYTYQWFSSNDNVNFQVVAGATSMSYQPGVLAMTTYFKRQDACNGSLVYTNTATITVNPPTAGVPPASNIAGSTDANMNWQTNTSYDPTGNVLSQGKVFFDNVGAPLQMQDKIKYRRDDYGVFTHVFASQPLRDVYGRGVANTMPAPIDYADFKYKSDFVRAADGSNYTYKNFDRFNPSGSENDKTNSPDPVGGQATKGTLGWYFSANNSWEQYNPTTSFPYSRQVYYNDGSGVEKKQGGSGESFKIGSDHETAIFTTPVINELDNYLLIRKTFFTKADIGELPTSLQYQTLQTISRDANGNESFSISDKAGKLLMSGMSGSEYTPPANLMIVATPLPANYTERVTITGSSIAIQIFNISNININLYFLNSNGTLTSVYTGLASGLAYNSNLGSGTLIVESDAAFIISYTVNGGQQIVPSTVYNGAQVSQVGYFKILNDNTSVSLTGNYTLYDMNTDIVMATSPLTTLNKGYYKLVANTGYASISYANGYAAVSYNFYNQLGRLIASITPEGVKKLYGTGINNYATKTDLPFVTLYTYDVRGELVSMKTPDAGTSNYIYRADGKIRFSQNASQLASGTGKYSYTNYDPYGRVIEGGEYQPDISGIIFNSAGMTSILENTSNSGGLTSGIKNDIVVSVYDIADGSHNQAGYVQDAINLGSAISTTLKYSSITNNVPLAANIISQTWYNYDEEGKISWQIKMIQNAGGGTPLFKTIDYAYDGLGRLIKKIFQKNNSAEVFVHYYKYDPTNQQLWKVYTNTSDIAITEPLATSYKLQATYKYYLHGGLKRIELGSQLQGVDFTYTLQGSLKAINNNKRSADPGGDGITNSFPMDAFGLVLDYFTDDYKNSRSSGTQPINGVTAANDNFAGNIKAVSWYSEKPASTGVTDDPTAYIFKYDNKYQLTESSWGTGLVFSATQGVASTFTSSNANSEKILDPANNTNPGYDANGNILYFQRTDPAGVLKDKFAYLYNTNKNQVGSIVNTATGSPSTYATYLYNENGQVIAETNVESGKTKYSQYDVSGKIIMVAKDAGFAQVIAKYGYDETGKRIQKILYNTVTNSVSQVTYYFDDVVFTQDVISNIYQSPLAQEYAINGGNGRLGVFYRQGSSPVYAYQMTDHLGNVRAVIAQNANTYTVRMYNDFYPFGMLIATGGTNDYRYGYQGSYSEKDGETDWNSFELRKYDSRIARWMQSDPEGQFYSPYVGMGNDPANGVDEDGGFFTDFINKENGQHYYVNDGVDQVVFLNKRDFTDVLIIGSKSSWSQWDTQNYFSIIEKGEKLDWKSDIGYLARIGMGEFSTVTDDPKARQVAIESVMNRLEYKGKYKNERQLRSTTVQGLIESNGAYAQTPSKKIYLDPYGWLEDNGIAKKGPYSRDGIMKAVVANSVWLAYALQHNSIQRIGKGVMFYYSPPANVKWETWPEYKDMNIINYNPGIRKIVRGMTYTK